MDETGKVQNISFPRDFFPWRLVQEPVDENEELVVSVFAKIKRKRKRNKEKEVSLKLKFSSVVVIFVRTASSCP